jgi:hypothetical protein
MEWDDTSLMIGTAIISEFYDHWQESGGDDLEYITTTSILESPKFSNGL